MWIFGLKGLNVFSSGADFEGQVAVKLIVLKISCLLYVKGI